jgi:iron complex outermembrane receptor protein
MKVREIRKLSLLLASGSVICSQALAQSAPAEEDDGAPPTEVVITGSRIARPDYEANSPITTVSQDILENSGSFALESKLLQLPQFAGALNSQYSTGYFNSGAATLNLRNLGDNRNLVLMDGRRLQPSTSTLAIDINTIPSALIDNVEVLRHERTRRQRRARPERRIRRQLRR